MGIFKKIGQSIISGAISNTRQLTGPSQMIFTVIAVFFSAFFLYDAAPPIFGALDVELKRGLFMMLMSTMIFMKFPGTSKSSKTKVSSVDLLFILLSVVSFGYWILNYDKMVLRFGSINELEIIMGTIAIIVAVEVGRRVLGLIFASVAVIFMVYALAGHYLGANLMSSAVFSWERIVSTAYSINGMFGMVLDIVATYVVLFVVFGSLMKVFGADIFFIQFPYALTAGMRGGPAKAAVLASGLFGSISGSATANTAATGSFTIPLMIKTGYPREIAGAIEPAASTGGMFMPPVMGAATFLMADMLRVPYGEIVKVAIVPAIIYFFSVFMICHYQALAKGIAVIPKEERPNPWDVLRQGWYFAIPIIVLLVLLLSLVSPARSIFYTIILTVVISVAMRIIRSKQPLATLKQSGRDLIFGLRDGAEDSLTVGAVVGSTGLVISMVMLTGIAFLFTSSIMSITGGLLPIGIFMALLAGYVLGMGMTVTSVYILLAILVVPGLVTMGVDPLAAHLLVFWFSQTSNISPPVCIAAFVGAGIAKAPPFKVGFNAMAFGAFIFIMPLLFIYSEILMPNGLNGDAVFAMVSGFLAAIPYAAGISGYLVRPLNIFERVILLCSGVLMVLPGLWTDTLGLAIFAAVFIIQKRLRKGTKVEEEAVV